MLRCENEIIKLWKDRVVFIDSTKISGLIMSDEIFKFGIGSIDWIWNVWRKTNTFFSKPRMITRKAYEKLYHSIRVSTYDGNCEPRQ